MTHSRTLVVMAIVLASFLAGCWWNGQYKPFIQHAIRKGDYLYVRYYNNSFLHPFVSRQFTIKIGNWGDMLCLDT